MDTLVFWFTKLTWMLLAPDNLFLLSLFGLWLLLRLGWNRAARRILAVLIAALGLTALFPVDEWLMYPLESQYLPPSPLPQKVDGIILLGGAEEPLFASAWGDAEVNLGADRYLAFLMLARRYPDAKLVFTGGSGSLGDTMWTEADVAGRILAQQGLSRARLVVESSARNTVENAQKAHALASPQPDETWILITSAFHMPRAVGSFCKAGWPVIAYPVDHRSAPGRLLRPDLDLAGHAAGAMVGAREWTGLAAYYLAGKTEALLPVSCLPGRRNPAASDQLLSTRK